MTAKKELMTDVWFPVIRRKCINGRNLGTLGVHEIEFVVNAETVWKLSIKVFNTANGEFIFEPIKEEQQIWSLPHIESGRHFIVSDEKNMKIIDLRNGKLLSKIPRQEHNMNRGFFSPSGARIAIIYENNSVRIWDSLSGDAITPSLQHNSIIRTLRFSDDGTKIGRECRRWSCRRAFLS